MATVLLAEANLKLRSVYVKSLMVGGIHVETADDDDDCINKLDRLKPDVLVLDFDLLKRSCEEVFEAIRIDSRLSSIRVILIVNAKYQPNPDHASKPPIVQLLTKPFPFSKLLESVLAALAPNSEPRTVANRDIGILIVDDERSILNLLRMFLELQGFRVWTAEGGQEAIDNFTKFRDTITIVLIDIQMPVLNGPQTVERLRQIRPEVPVCYMTGDPGLINPNDLLRGGARHVFKKPFRLTELVGVLRQLVSY